MSTYGSRAVPVSSQHQVTTLQRYSSNFTPIIVSEAHEAMIKASSDYTAPSKDKITESTPLSYIEDLFKPNGSLKHGVLNKLNHILEISVNWTWK